MLIWLFLLGGAATFGLLIVCLVIAERELKAKSRHLTEMELKLATASDTTIDTEQEKKIFPETERQIADLREEKSRLLTQTDELRPLVLAKTESQLSGLNGLYQQLAESGKSWPLL